MRRVGVVAWLTTLWVVLWRDLSLANVVSGVVVALVVLTLFRVPTLTVSARLPHRHTVRPVALVRFLAWFLSEVVAANLVVAREIITPGDTIRAGIVAVPLRGHSDLVTTVVAGVVTLTPGTLTAEVRGTPPVLYVHVMHLDDPEALRREVLAVEEKVIRVIGAHAAAPDGTPPARAHPSDQPAPDATPGPPGDTDPDEEAPR